MIKPIKVIKRKPMLESIEAEPKSVDFSYPKLFNIIEYKLSIIPRLIIINEREKIDKYK